MNAEEAVRPKKDQIQNNVSVVATTPSPVQTSVNDLPGIDHIDSSSDDVGLVRNPYAPRATFSPGSAVLNITSSTVDSSVDYPNLFAEGVEISKTLKASKVYGAYFVSTTTTPAESVIGSAPSSRNRGLNDLAGYEVGEPTLEACIFCLKNIYPAEETVTQLPCCGFVLHEPCFRKRGWHHMPACDLRCPDCSHPPELTIDYDKEPEPPDVEDTQTFASKLRLLVRKRGVTSTLREIHRAYQTGDGIKESLAEVTKNEIIRSNLRLDDLLTAGFSLDSIHTTMGVKSWEDFMAIGFNENKLPKLEAQVGTLIRLYGINSICLRRDLRLSLKKLAGLNLRSTTLRDLGFDTHELCFMGLQKNGIKWFRNLTMANWVEHLNFSKVHLGILKIDRRDFDNQECLASVFWNAEALRVKLNITVGNAIGIRLIDPRDLEQREWRRSYTIANHKPNSVSNNNKHSGAATSSPHHSRHRRQHHPRAYDGFRTNPAPQRLVYHSQQPQQQQQPTMYQLHPELFQPNRINVAVRIPPPAHQAPPGILPDPRQQQQQLYYHVPGVGYQHSHRVRTTNTAATKPREVRMRGTSVKNRGGSGYSPVLKNRTGNFS